MKTIITGLIICLIATFAISQENEKRGYISITMGPAFPLGDFAETNPSNSNAGFAETGLNINLVNFGYSFGKGIGVTASWFGAAHSLELQGISNEATWGYGGLFAGPMYTLSVSEKIRIDFKMMIGYVYATLDIGDGEDEFEGTATGFSVGTTFRFNFAKRWAFITHADFMTAKPTMKFEDFSLGDRKIAVLNINPGIAFRL